MEEQADKFRELKRNNNYLLVASARGYKADVKALIERGAETSCQDKSKLTPAHYAAAHGHEEVLRLLWSKGTDLDAESPGGQTPLHLAAAAGQTDCVRFLVGSGSWVDCFDAQDCTPLHLAARNGHADAIDALLACKAAVSPANKLGLTPVAEALLGGHESCAELLAVAQHESLHALAKRCRPQGFSLLHAACGLDRPRVAALLVELGLEVEELAGATESSPLHAAAAANSPGCARVLLAAGADAGALDAAGRAPLECASGGSDAELRAVLGGNESGSSTAVPLSKPCPAASALEAYRGLSGSERLKKAEHWALLSSEDFSPALAALDLPPPAAALLATHVAAAGDCARARRVARAVLGLRADAEFQADARRSRAVERVEELKGRPEAYAKAVAEDSELRHVLGKVRSAHALAQAQGRRTLALADVIVGEGAAGEARERELREEEAQLQARGQAHVAAAAAVAGWSGGEEEGGVEQVAADMFEAVIQAWRQRRLEAKEVGGEEEVVQETAPAESSPPPSLAQQRASTVKGKPRVRFTEAPAPNPRQEEGQEDDDLPEWMRGGFSWPKGPLKGYKVLDLGQVVAGNFAGAVLAYYGADVIKVEPPGRGDALRTLRLPDSSGTSLWWRAYGRNRRCVTADLRRPQGRELVRRLAARCDALVENFRPGVMEEWGLGPGDLSPDLVYARISGYGQTGPRARQAGYASVCEAFGGMRALTGFSDRPPARTNLSLGDTLAGFHAAFGVVLALLHRERRSRTAAGEAASRQPLGQVVDASISESVFNMLEGCVPEFFAHGHVRQRSGTTITGVVPSGCWEAQDGQFVIIGGNGDKVYDRLMAAMGRPDMGLGNPRFATDAARCVAVDEIHAVIQAWVASRPSTEIVGLLTKARVPAGPILSMSDIAQEEQYLSRDMFQRRTAPGGEEEFVLPAMVPILSQTPGTSTWAGPELGQHTDEVLSGELGMSQSEIQALREEGVV